MDGHEQWLADRQAELDAADRVRAALDTVAAEVAACPSLWSWGDAGGAWVHHELTQRVQEALA